MKDTLSTKRLDLSALGCGIGLHREHFETVLCDRPAVRWFELISENFMVEGGRPRLVLDRVRADYPVPPVVARHRPCR